MKTQIRIDEALSSLIKSGNLFSEQFKDNYISIEIYRPELEDLQMPHDRDELYMVISGSGTFRQKDEIFEFRAGDLLLVPSGEVHRFEQFTEDFVAWVIFYGAVQIEIE
jgi:mannose-6-phosphate isomerase-like protein (cupin superfamily)